MQVRQNIVGNDVIGQIVTGDLPADLSNRDRRAEATDRLMVSRSRVLVMRGGQIRQNGRSMLFVSGSYRKMAA
ncbi:MAG: hypothetical protein JXA71_19515 [Chitinispirillaceae bacterium]|nr:hypothetical protein [Chitinispirillaceae bacterium]